MTTKEKLQNINVSDSLTLYDVLTSESVYWSLRNSIKNPSSSGIVLDNKKLHSYYHLFPNSSTLLM